LSYTAFHYDDFSVCVEPGDPSARLWLGEFLSPAFRLAIGAAAPAAREGLVRLRSDAGEHRALETLRRSHAASQRPCFALDSKLLEHPVWMRGADAIAHDASHDLFYVLSQGTIDVVAGPAARAGRFGLMRVVRELIAQRAVREPGRVQLHAACVAFGGRAVALLGPKAAGKTTLLMALLEHPGVSYVANDRLFATDRGTQFEARGIPTSVSVRPGTLEHYPRLARTIPDVRSPSHLTLDEARAELAARGPRDPRLRTTLSPALLVQVMEVEALAAASLQALVFLDLLDAPEPWSLEALSPRAALESLTASLFGPRTRRPPTELERWAGFDDPPALPDEALLRALVARVGCFRYRVGRGSDGVAAEEFLDRVCPPEHGV
jgi:hypothetical protein